jgi:hypothetical protein
MAPTRPRKAPEHPSIGVLLCAWRNLYSVVAALALGRRAYTARSLGHAGRCHPLDSARESFYWGRAESEPGVQIRSVTN